MVAFSTLEHWNNDNLEIKSLDFSSSRGPPSAQDIKIKRERERRRSRRRRRTRFQRKNQEEDDGGEKLKKKMVVWYR